MEETQSDRRLVGEVVDVVAVISDIESNFSMVGAGVNPCNGARKLEERREKAWEAKRG